MPAVVTPGATVTFSCVDGTFSPSHDSVDWAEGVIANPGAWSHYSYAIHDALELFSGPLVEVHLSNPEEREEQWRHHSVIAALATKRILGHGPDGYREALEYLGASS